MDLRNGEKVHGAGGKERMDWEPGLHPEKCCVRLKQAMAPHSRTLAWKIPWTEEPGGLQSMGSLEVGHD